MGTNYYLRSAPPCPTCGHQDEGLHIGKSSAGWCFSLHVIPERGINELHDWAVRWNAPNARIVDECGSNIAPDEMRDIITKRSWPRKLRSFDYAANHAVPGPANLVRHAIDGRHCIGHGSGTWDLIIGEFS